MIRDPHQLLIDVVGLAREAGREILGVYASAFTVQEKSDSSPLTEADMRAQDVLVRGLRRLAPEVPILSEESDDIPFETRRHWDWLWIVDPLDGTKEFIQRNGEFTVNVALVHRHRPVLGVVHAPAAETDYYACEGYGAFKSSGGRARPITVETPARRPVRVVGSRSHRGSSLDAFLGRVGAHELVAVGSSLKFCLVAEGAADVYPRLGPTCEWDTAAGQCVLEQAGGQVVDLDEGRPLAYNARPEVLNPFFLAFADDATDWRALLG